MCLHGAFKALTAPTLVYAQGGDGKLEAPQHLINGAGR